MNIKRSFIMTFIAFMLATMALVSCGGKEQGASETLKSTSDNMNDTTILSEKPVYITKMGIDTIRVGMKIKDIPEQIEGLYDNFAQGPDTQDIEAIQYDFSKDGKVRFSALDFGEGRIDVVFAGGYDIEVQVSADESLKIGDNFNRVLQLSNVHSQWIPYDNLGMWAWEWNGLWLMPDTEGITESFSQKLFNPEKTPKSSDFNDNSKIGYIGTGLPF